MAQITIDLPDSIDDIPSAIAQLQKQLGAINAQREAIIASIRSVQIDRDVWAQVRGAWDAAGGGLVEA